eukprot:gene4254-6033_t
MNKPNLSTMSVKQGLRKLKPSESGGLIATKNKEENLFRMCSNPQERLCELLSTWKILISDNKQLQSIPLKFQSLKEYISIWEPLLLDEIKANIKSNFLAKSTAQMQSFPLIFSVTDASSNSNLCTFESTFSDAPSQPATLDLVILHWKPLPSNDALKDNELSGKSSIINDFATNPYLLGVVVGHTMNNKEKLYQIRVNLKVWNTVKDNISANSVAHDTSSGSFIFARKGSSKIIYTMKFSFIENLRSCWREFMSIHQSGTNVQLISELLGSDYIDMPRTPTTPNEFKPDDFIPKKALSGVTDKFMKYLNLRYNSSQLKAITNAATHAGFTLIQGPPGTGKTTTIIGILNAIHIREYNKYYQLCIQTILGIEGIQCRSCPNQSSWLQMIAKLSKTKPRILVTAPSNIAVDNIIQRIMESGFIDGNGGTYNPNILRVGGGKTPRVKSVSLEDTMAQEYNINADQSVNDLSSSIDSIIHQLVHVQSLLINLNLAFAKHPLPEGWELRVRGDNAMPYWVDHNSQKTSNVPPEFPIGNTSNIRRSHFNIQTLPEYLIHSHQLTQLIDSLDNCNLKLSRMQALITSRHSQQTKHLVEISIIESAQILFTTLNSSGHPSLEATEFCVTVIDEAAQCVEPSALIALRRGCTQCVMVGDQMQLPATIYSTRVKEMNYDRSLLQRLIDGGHPYTFLDTQYRMHPSISKFPSMAFYDEKLKDGVNVTIPNYLPSFLQAQFSLHDDAKTEDSKVDENEIKSEIDFVPVFSSFMFFDFNSQENNDSSKNNNSMTMSKSNTEEALLCLNVMKSLISEANRANNPLGTIGIITPYNDQMIEITKLFKRNNLIGEVGTDNSTLDIEISSVDSFQGREKDIIIFSTVRGNDNRNIGFVSDIRRMNVSITRARFGLFIIGNGKTLSCNQYWRKFLDHAYAENVLIKVGNANDNISELLKNQRLQKLNYSNSNVSIEYDSNNSLNDNIQYDTSLNENVELETKKSFLNHLNDYSKKRKREEQLSTTPNLLKNEDDEKEDGEISD